MQKKTDERVRGRAMETEETIRAREAGWIGEAGSEEIRLLLQTAALSSVLLSSGCLRILEKAKLIVLLR